MLPPLWPSPPGRAPQTPTPPIRAKRRRASEPTPFAGLPHQPPCPLGEQEPSDSAPAPPGRPDPLPPIPRRPRTVDPSLHCCPHLHCDYRGWRGLNNLRANGQPRGGPWRPFYCRGWRGFCPEHHGTRCHGKQTEGERIGRVLTCLAEGRGIRATARVFAVDANTVLHWLVEAAEQRTAFCASFLCDLHVQQLQRDELYAVLRALNAGAISEDEASQRLERSPDWVWTALAPDRKVLLVIDVGTRTLAMAQRVGPQGVQRGAPGGVPLCLTDGLKDYGTACWAPCGQWVHPARRRDKGPLPKPRWGPRPELLYAQVVKSSRRWRSVGINYRVVCGTMERVQQGLSAGNRKINTALVERLNLDIRQRVAAGGRRGNTLCQGEDGIRQPLTVSHAYDNGGLPHSSLRQPLPVPEITNGSGSAKLWRPCTPAMAAGLTDHVWS